jgi:hypothetical protein
MITTNLRNKDLGSGILDRARELVQPGRLFDPDDQRVLAAAAEQLGDNPSDERDRRVLEIAGRMKFYVPEPVPHPPTPELDGAIDAQAALVEVEVQKVRDAQQQMVAAHLKARSRPSAANQGAAVDADHALEAAEAVLRPLASRLNRLVQQRENVRRALTLAEHTP